MKKFFFFVTLFFGMIIVFSSYFIVNETQQVVITRFGSVIGKPIQSAGIYFKLPIIDTANYFDSRIVEWDGDTSQPIPTRDKKNIIVDATARWRITDPLIFMQKVGTEIQAQSRLDDIIDSNVRDVISRYDLIELVRNSNRVLEILQNESGTDSVSALTDPDVLSNKIKVGREKTTREILEKSKKHVSIYGIDLIDVRVKGIMYSPSVLNTVYNSMISQYDIRAQNLRSEGDKQRSTIEGETELEIKKIRSEAYKKAQFLKGEGDGTSAKIYAGTLQVDPGFYHFLKSLEGYGAVIKENTTVILSTDSQFYKVLRDGDKIQ